MTKKIVIMTEKKDQAEKLVAAMGWRRGQGCWVGKLEGADVTVVTAKGHLITLQTPDEAIPGLKWDQPEQLLNIPRSIPIKIGDDSKGFPVHAQPKAYIANIKKHLDVADELIIATDSDREGEAIGWSVMNFIGFTGPVRRAWFAAGLDKKSMQDAMANLRDPSISKSWFRASEARGTPDWGYQFPVRAYTHYASYSCLGPNLGQGSGRSRVVSVGRVQTPTLGMIVKRDLEIEGFVKKDHFKIFGDFIPVGSADGVSAAYSPVVTEATIDSQPAGVSWDPSKRQPKEGEPEPLDIPLYTGKQEVNSFKARLMSAADQAKITAYNEGLRSEAPPKTFELVDAKAALSSAVGISPGLAQTVFEDLYEQGWTSYARTSKSELPMNLFQPSVRNAMLNSIMGLPDVSEQAKTVADIHNGKHDTYKPFTPSVYVKKEMEHYGIVPTEQPMNAASFSKLSPKKKDGPAIKHTADHMRAGYLLIAKQFVQALYPPAKYATQTVKFEVPVEDILGNNSSAFKANAERMKDPGWRLAFGTGAEKNNSMPPQIKGNSALLTNVDLRPLETKPPSRYTEKTLEKGMASIGRTVTNPKLRALLKNSEGIGTPATRKTVVETLLSREYIEVKGKTYHSTPKGRDLIKIVPDWLSNAETTALWEDYLAKICNERDDNKAIKMRDEFIEKQMLRLEALIKDLMNRYNNNLGARISAAPSKVTPKMKNFIKSIAAKKGIPVPKGALTDGAKAKAFFDEHLPKRQAGQENTPSQGQIDLFDKIAKNVPSNISVPVNIKEDRKACSAFIDANIGYLPPSAGQAGFAEKLIAKLTDGKTAPDNVLKYSSVCKAFIDEQTKDWDANKGKGKAKGKGGYTKKK